MSTKPAQAIHWTDEQLIAALYGLGPENGTGSEAQHLDQCPECRGRLSALQANRQALESDAAEAEVVSFEFLAAQRRAIYEKLASPAQWWSALVWRRWAPVVATLMVLGGGIAVYQEQHRHQVEGSQLSDAQLAQEVSRMSQEYEEQSTAPLQGLFE